jgi:hypothetical protein
MRRGRFLTETALFRPCLDPKKILGLDTVAFSFLFDKHCLIIE